MKLGVLTEYSEERIEFLSRIGFRSVELEVGRELADAIVKGERGDIRETCDKRQMTISALGCYLNHLDPDDGRRQANQEHLKKLIEAAEKLGVGVVCTFAGRDPEKSLDENIPGFKKAFSELARFAADHQVKIAFENCTAMFGHPFRSGNIAYTPEAWAKMFDAVPSPALGLEYDPSHLYWLQCDYIQAIYDFRDRIYHVHAKDTEIMEDVLARHSIYGTGWWRFRIPGWGEVDWKRVFMALIDIGYNGGVDIEHEDPIFEGDRYDEGLVRGFAFLSPFFPAKLEAAGQGRGED